LHRAALPARGVLPLPGQTAGAPAASKEVRPRRGPPVPPGYFLTGAMCSLGLTAVACASCVGL